jgi:monoterpene epsilon-lactone hydrolase
MVQRSAQNETISQRALAAVLRGALNLALKPGFRAGRPIEQQRRWLERVAQLTLVPREAAFTAATVGGVPGEWVSGRGPASPHRVILYLHGGAYCVGSPLTHRALTGNLALAVEARVFVADYRLAPEHPFPAALDDAVAAYEGLLANGHEPSDLVIAGDSAGGGLTAATALRLRELGRPLPSALVLFSPWTDLSLAELGPEPPGEPMITRPWVAECAGFYLRYRRRWSRSARTRCCCRIRSACMPGSGTGAWIRRFPFIQDAGTSSRHTPACSPTQISRWQRLEGSWAEARAPDA